MKKFRVLNLLILAAGLICYSSCGDDDTVGPCDSINATYDGDVKEIINKTCAYAGCHSGADGSTDIAEAARDYTSFDGLKHVVEDGHFAERVLEMKDMPPDYAPDPNPKTLSDTEIEILTCWKDAGYPR